MNRESNLRLYLAFLGRQLVKLSKWILVIDLCALGLIFLEGVQLEHYVIPVVFLGLSYGLRQIGISLSQLA